MSWSFIRGITTFSPLTVALANVAGCSTPSPEDLEAKFAVTNPQALLKSGSTLTGGDLEGAFSLEMALNPNVAESTTIHVEKFALQSTSGDALIDPIPLPVGSKVDQGLASGDSARLDYSFQAPNLTSELVASLCTGQVVYVATLNDSAQNRTKTVKSDAFSVSGCQ